MNKTSTCIYYSGRKLFHDDLLGVKCSVSHSLWILFWWSYSGRPSSQWTENNKEKSCNFYWDTELFLKLQLHKIMWTRAEVCVWAIALEIDSLSENLKMVRGRAFCLVAKTHVFHICVPVFKSWLMIHFLLMRTSLPPTRETWTESPVLGFSPDQPQLLWTFGA